MHSKTTIVLSIMTAFFIMSKIIPFNIGEPLYVFFGVLFYSFVGYTCIAYIYVLVTFDVVINIPAFIAAGPMTREMFVSVAAFDSSITPYTTQLIATVLTDYVVAAMLIAMFYFGITMSIVGCHFLIKRLKILRHFSSVSA